VTQELLIGGLLGGPDQPVAGIGDDHVDTAVPVERLADDAANG
jgi:hypothetical protein